MDYGGRSFRVQRRVVWISQPAPASIPADPPTNRRLAISTYGGCDFLLSWQISNGQLGQVDLSGLNVSIAGT